MNQSEQGAAMYPQAEVDAMIAHVGRRIGRLREVLDEADQLARAGEQMGYESAFRTLRGGVLELLVLDCPGCHESGGDRFRRGEDIRQRANGDLVCTACGRVTAPAEPPAEPPLLEQLGDVRTRQRGSDVY